MLIQDDRSRLSKSTWKAIRAACPDHSVMFCHIPDQIMDSGRTKRAQDLLFSHEISLDELNGLMVLLAIRDMAEFSTGFHCFVTGLFMGGEEACPDIQILFALNPIRGSLGARINNTTWGSPNQAPEASACNWTKTLHETMWMINIHGSAVPLPGLYTSRRWCSSEKPKADFQAQSSIYAYWHSVSWNT